jgi:hypothetical protein
VSRLEFDRCYLEWIRLRGAQPLSFALLSTALIANSFLWDYFGAISKPSLGGMILVTLVFGSLYCLLAVLILKNIDRLLGRSTPQSILFARFGLAHAPVAAILPLWLLVHSTIQYFGEGAYASRIEGLKYVALIAHLVALLIFAYLAAVNFGFRETEASTSSPMAGAFGLANELRTRGGVRSFIFSGLAVLPTALSLPLLLSAHFSGTAAASEIEMIFRVAGLWVVAFSLWWGFFKLSHDTARLIWVSLMTATLSWSAVIIWYFQG